MQKLLCKLSVWLLKSKRLDNESKSVVLNALLSNMNALPISDILSFDLQGSLKLNGKPLTIEQAVSIKEGAVSLKNNATYRLIKEQIAFKAVNMGIHNAVNLDMVLFSKAVLWVQEREVELIESLSSEF